MYKQRTNNIELFSHFFRHMTRRKYWNVYLGLGHRKVILNLSDLLLSLCIFIALEHIIMYAKNSMIIFHTFQPSVNGTCIAAPMASQAYARKAYKR